MGGSGANTVDATAYSGTQTLTKIGTNQVSLTGALTYTGSTTVQTGTLAVSGVTAVNGFRSSTLIPADSTFVVDTGSAAASGNRLFTFSGSGTFIKTGTGLWRTANGGSVGAVFALSPGAWIDIRQGTIQNDFNGTKFAANQASVNIASGAMLDFYAENGQLDALTGSGTLQNNYAGGFHLVTLGVAGGSGTFAGVIRDGPNSGSFELSLVKSGSGTQVLSGANAYTGSTSIVGGTLRAAAANALSASSAVILTNTSGATLDLDGFSNTIASLAGGGTSGGNVSLGSGTLTFGGDGTSQTFAGIISGAGRLVKVGSGTQTLAGGNTYSGGTTISAGRLVGTTSSLQGSITNNAAVEFAQATSGTYLGAMSGSGSLTKSGSGALTLAGANSFSGTTTISAGTLRLVDGGTVAGAVQVPSGTLAFAYGSDATFTNALGIDGTGTAGAIVNDGPGTVTIGLGTDTDIGADNADTLTFGGAGTIVVAKSLGVGKSLNVVKTDSGTTILLSASNNYTGTTRVNGGTLQVGNGGSAGTLGSGGITLTSGTLLFLRSGSLSLANTLAIPSGSSAAIVNDGTGLVTFTGADSIAAGAAELVLGGSGNGVINKPLASVSGSLPLTKVGSGTWTLTNASSDYTGPTTVRNGTLEVTGRLGAGTYDFEIRLEGGELLISSTSNQTLAGVISGGGRLRKAGSGSLTLTGTNTFSSDLVVDAGRLVGTTVSLPTSITNKGTVEFAQAATGTYAGVISGTGAVVKSSAGTLVLLGNNTFSGTTTISTGTLQIGNGGTTGWIDSGAVANNATLAFRRSDDIVFGATVTGSGSVIQSGSGLVALTGSNGYTGTTTVASGTLQAGNGGTAGTLGSGTVTTNATLAFNRFDDVTVANAITGTGHITKLGAGSLTLSGTTSHSGGTTVEAGRLVGTTSALQGAITNDAAVEFAQAATGTYSSLVGGTGSFTKSGTGTLVLTGSIASTGATTISTGTLQVGSGGTAGELVGTGTIVTNGVLAYNRSDAITISRVITGTGAFRQLGTGTTTLSGANSYSGGTTVSAGRLVGSADSLQGAITNNAAVEFAQGSSGTYAGVMSGSGALTKTGARTLVLVGGNTYTGTTRLAGGVLQVGNGGSAGTLGSGGITLESGTLLFMRSGSLSLANTLTIPSGSSAAIVNDGTGLVTFTGADSIAAGAAELVLGGSGNGVINKPLASVSGSLPLTKIGSGTWTLTNASTNYTGPTTLRDGTLEVTGLLGAGTYASSIVLDGGELFMNSASNQTLSGVIRGGGRLRKAGSGTLTLTGTNTFSSDLVVDAGRLIGTTVSLPTSIADKGTVEFAQAASGTYAGVISGTGALVKSSTGTLVLLGNNTFSGTTTISTGTLQIGNGGTAGALGSGDVVISGALKYRRSDSVSLANDCSGAGSLTQAGSGVLTLTATNTYTYTGGTILTAGKIVFGAANRLTDTGALTVTDAEVDLGGFSDTVGAVTLTNGTIANGALTGSQYDVASGFISASLGGAVAFTKTSTGTVTLSGSNGFTGKTTLSGGVVRIVDGGSLAAGSAIDLNDGFLEFDRTTPITVSNAIDALDGKVGDVPGIMNNGSGLVTLVPGSQTNIFVDNGEPLYFGGSGDIRVEKSIGSGGNASLVTKIGTGTVTLTNASNNWSGGTTVSEGVLQVGDGTSNGTVGSGTITITNGRLAFNRPADYTITEKIAAFQAGTTPGIDNNGAGLITLNASSIAFQAGASLTLGGSGNGALNGAINAAGGSATIVKDGVGTWSLNGDSNYAGPTTINGGTLAIITAGQLGGGTSGTGNYAWPINVNAGGFHYNSTSPQTLSGGIAGPGDLLKSATSTLTIAAATTFTGTTRVAGGRLTLAHVDGLAGCTLDLLTGDSGTVTFTVPGLQTYNIGALQGSRNLANAGNRLSVGGNGRSTTYSGSLSGSGGFTKVGAGTLTLTGSNAHTDGTTLAGGTLALGAAGALGATGTISFTGGTLRYSSSNTTDYSSRFSSAAGQQVSIDTNGQAVSLGSNLTSSGGSFTKLGTGTLTMSGTNSYSGGTLVAAGRLVGTAASLQGGIANNAAVEFSQAATGTYAGAMSGTGSLTKTGLGNLVISGTSTSTGPTLVSAGRLSVNGALGNTAVTVQGGAALGGAGSIAGSLAVLAGGTLAPGNSIESLAVGAVSFAAGSTFAYEVDSSLRASLGAAADLLVANGDLGIASGSLLSFRDVTSGSAQPFIEQTTVFAMINYSGTWNGGLFTYGGSTLPDNSRFFVGSQEWEIDYDSAAGGVNFTPDYLPGGSFVTVRAVPEPATIVLALVGAVAALACGRRRRHCPARSLGPWDGNR